MKKLFSFLMILVLCDICWSANSNGQLTDPKLDRIHSEAARFYYHNTDSSLTYLEQVLDENGQLYWATVFGDRYQSIRDNALGDSQVLYYEYYPPLKKNGNNKVAALYFHGGGYTVGYANQGYETEIKKMRELGFHVISTEYRRGWYGDGSSGPGGEPELSEAEGTLFSEAVDLAFTDVQDAWDHINRRQPGHARYLSGDFGFPSFAQWYLPYGFSAGGSIASRLALTHVIPPGRNVVGVLAGYGTHSVDEPVINFHVPVFLQAGLFDATSPVYDNYIYFDEDAPTAKGLFNLYEEMDLGGGDVVLLVSAQDGHGRGAYNNAQGEPEYIGRAIDFFKAIYLGNAHTNYQEFKFKRNAIFSSSQGAIIPINDDGNLYEIIGPNVGYSYVTSIDLFDATKLFVDGFVYDSQISVGSGFRYEPVQSDFEAGLRPSEVRTMYGLP